MQLLLIQLLICIINALPDGVRLPVVSQGYASSYQFTELGDVFDRPVYTQPPKPITPVATLASYISSTISTGGWTTISVATATRSPISLTHTSLTAVSLSTDHSNGLTVRDVEFNRAVPTCKPGSDQEKPRFQIFASGPQGVNYTQQLGDATKFNTTYGLRFFDTHSPGYIGTNFTLDQNCFLMEYSPHNVVATFDLGYCAVKDLKLVCYETDGTERPYYTNEIGDLVFEEEPTYNRSVELAVNYLSSISK